MSNELKSTEEKVKESIQLLSKLREIGIAPTDPAYKELSAKMSEWVKGVEPWNGSINFYRHNRRAVVNLPQKKKYVAKIDFLHHMF